MDVQAVGMEVDVTPQQLRLLDDVRTVLDVECGSFVSSPCSR